MISFQNPGGLSDEDREGLCGENPDALLADGFEGAFIGYGAQYGSPPLAIYDTERCVDILMRRDEMTYEEAMEYLSFNTLCAWMGEGTPIFMTPSSKCRDD